MSAKDQSSINVEEMVKEFVATRPRRPRSGRVVAGVAAGIGRRYAIDPVIVRVALVVAAIYGGAGIIAYLLGWLFLAAEEDEVSPFEALLGRGRSSTSRGLTIVLCVLLIPAAGGFLFGGHFSTIAGGVVLAGALFLLHRYRGDQGIVDPQPTRPVAGTSSGATPPASGATDSEGTAMTDSTTRLGPQDAVPPEYRNQPPAWDPLGAAPFAWDLPEPNPVPVAQPVVPQRRRTRTGLATMGLVLVTAATLAAVSPHASWLSLPHVIGILGGIVGVGLVVGAFTHSGRGLIPVAILLSVAGFFLTTAGFDGWHGAGRQVYQPATLSDVQPHYEWSVGNTRLDLSQLTGTGTVHTSLSLGVGDATVIVPDNATVHATCSTSVGHVHCFANEASGPNGPTVHGDQTGTGGPDITLDVHNGVGNVTVVDEDNADGSITVSPRGPGGNH